MFQNLLAGFIKAECKLNYHENVVITLNFIWLDTYIIGDNVLFKIEATGLKNHYTLEQSYMHFHMLQFLVWCEEDDFPVLSDSRMMLRV